MLVIFLLPVSINSLHDFLNHEHSVCYSKVNKHIHKKDVDCKLHLLKQSDSFLTSNTFDTKTIEINSSVVFAKYNYQKNYYQLPFSLRGPPFTI